MAAGGSKSRSHLDPEDLENVDVFESETDSFKPVWWGKTYLTSGSWKWFTLTFQCRVLFTLYFWFHSSSGMDILISSADCRKLTQESKELLCATCEMAQLRCAKLINVRGKVSSVFVVHIICSENVVLVKGEIFVKKWSLWLMILCIQRKAVYLWFC